MKKLMFMFLTVLFFTFTYSSVVIAEDLSDKRIAGKDRWETAVEVSKSGWDSSTTVVLATGYDFPDALAGGPLAYYHDAPILLTQKKSLGNATKNEIIRLGAEHVIILGGENAVPKSIENELESIGIRAINRIGGKTRYETAVLIAEELGSPQNPYNPIAPDTAFIVNAFNFPDALAIAPYAARMGYPILLTGAKKMSPETRDYFTRVENSFIIGGVSVVGKEVEANLPNVTRISGQDRFKTNARIVEYFEFGAKTAYITTGSEFADALTSSVLAAKNNAPLLLVLQNRIRESIEQKLPNYLQFDIIGGPSAISDNVAREILAFEKVEFEDDDLKAIIATYLQIPFEGEFVDGDFIMTDIQREITIKDMKKIDSIYHYFDIVSNPYQHVSSLVGLEHATNLENFSLYTRKPISDLTPLQNATKLKQFRLNNVNAKDLSPIANLLDLEYLTLEISLGNSVEDLSPLSNLEKLTDLTIFGDLKNIQPLSSLTNLKNLILIHSNISDITSLERLTKLERLTLHYNAIEDISALANLKNLKLLSLDHNQIIDITPLAQLDNLPELSLNGNYINNLDALRDLTNLKILHLANMNLSDITALKNLTYLARLDLRSNQITDLSPLTNLVRLEFLYLDHNPLIDISALVTNAKNRQKIGYNFRIIGLERIGIKEGSKIYQDVEALRNMEITVYIDEWDRGQ